MNWDAIPFTTLKNNNFSYLRKFNTKKPMDNFDQYLQNKANQSILLYAIQRAIFCPSCERVLNIKSAALMTVKKDGKDAYVRIMCGGCYEQFDKDKFLTECKAKLQGELSLEFITNFKPKKPVKPLANLSKYIQNEETAISTIGEKYNNETNQYIKVKYLRNGNKVILCKEFSEFNFFIYKHKEKFTIIEETTGLALCKNQNSESAAIKLSLSRLKKIGLDNFKQLVDRSDKLKNISIIEALTA